jgi:hypothetical protein
MHFRKEKQYGSCMPFLMEEIYNVNRRKEIRSEQILRRVYLLWYAVVSRKGNFKTGVLIENSVFPRKLLHRLCWEKKTKEDI